MKSTRFQFSRFYGYFRKIVGWILVGFEKFPKSSRFFLVGFGLFFFKLVGFSLVGFAHISKKYSVLISRFFNRLTEKLVGFLATD